MTAYLIVHHVDDRLRKVPKILLSLLEYFKDAVESLE